MTTSPEQTHDDQLIDQRVLRLNAWATAVGVGLLCGFGLFAATLILALRGGPWTGQHLGLLGQFFPGYSVTIAGSVTGFIYAFVTGGAAGLLLASVYNRLAR